MRFTIFLFIAIIFFACKNEQANGALVIAKKYYPNKQLMEYREFRNDMKN